MTSPLTAPDAATAALASLHDVVTAYRTCEFATVTASGTPIAWPAVCDVAPDGTAITLTTSIALPRKALNIRRDPRVALLFSDPTGSGRSDLPQVLVRGTATCAEEIHTSPSGLEAYWQQLWERQPGSPDPRSALTRLIMDFYFMRLVVTVAPLAVTTSPPLVRTAPDHGVRPAPGDGSPWAEVARRAGDHPDAVLASVRDGEPPVLRRVRVRAEPGGRLGLTPSGDAADETSARGNLLFHAHDERIGSLRQVAATGTVTTEGGRTTFVPERFLPGMAPDSPLALARTLLRLRRTTRRYLADRGLPRPRIAWDEFADLRSHPATTGPTG